MRERLKTHWATMEECESAPYSLGDVLIFLKNWRRIYARKLIHKSDMLRFMELWEQGSERYARRVLNEGFRWVPYWREGDGSLRWPIPTLCSRR